MPQRSKGARLWFRTDKGVWYIKDGGQRFSTGCAERDVAGAERALAIHIGAKAARAAAEARDRDPAHVPVADVLAAYWLAKGEAAARPNELAAQIERLNAFFGDRMVGDVAEDLCREYLAHRGAPRSAAHELAYLKAAINRAHDKRTILYPVPVWMPPPSAPRERWLTRDEMARLLWACWRQFSTHKGVKVHQRRHVAMYILIARYTGTRSGAICAASWAPEKGRGWVDLEHGIFHRAAAGERTTNKRKPTVRLPAPLLAHLRRWRSRRPDDRYVVQWGGKPVGSVKRAWKGARKDANLDESVTPHVLRHTAITWAMQAGADKWEAAGFFGVSLRVIEDVYGHHHPDHQESVHRAMSAKRSITVGSIKRGGQGQVDAL